MAFITGTVPLLRGRGTAARVTCLAKRRGKRDGKRTPKRRGGAGGASAKSSLPEGEADLMRSFESDENVKPLQPSTKKKKPKAKAATGAASVTMPSLDREKLQSWVTRATWASLGILVGWFVLVHTVLVGDWTGGGIGGGGGGGGAAGGM